MLADLKRDIDLVSIVQPAGVELKRSGSRHVGLCPFHDEKTPSFYVFNDNRFKCFGCGESGDVIDFVQKYHGLSFQDALKHLGLEQGEITPETAAKIERRKAERRKADAKKQFRTNLQNTLLTLISATKKAAKNFKTIDDLEKYGDILHPLPWWEYCLDVLTFGTKEEQEVVCQQFTGEEVLPVKGFFKSDFNFSMWLSNFLKEMGCNETNRNTEVD